MEKYVGKLVRDKIPQEIVEGGRTPATRHLTDGEFLVEAKRKLVEEAQEAFQEDSQEGLINELVDIIELIDTITTLVSIPPRVIKKARKKKAQEKGVFDQKIFLESISESSSA